MRHLLALLALVPACARVRLAPLSGTATPAVRLGQYQALRPAEVSRAPIVLRMFSVVGSTNELALADGTAISHVEDVLPVVAPSSPTAAAVQRSRGARRHRLIAIAAAAVAFALGSALSYHGNRHDSAAEAWTGEGLVLGGLLGVGLAWYDGAAEDRAAFEAFTTYDDGLRSRLNLCVNGLDVVPCEQLVHP